ncbi:unnamed protein product [Brassica napus]|uniref:(rape) hypothetical protein n=1 Tax=Brassica napus TaxID=3708 RepID=A0A816NTT4_BRANA|nr:unnamed protein product [Brassica napus]
MSVSQIRLFYIHPAELLRSLLQKGCFALHCVCSLLSLRMMPKRVQLASGVSLAVNQKLCS